MAIEPIKIFQGGDTALAGIFQNGNATITGILDRAVQIGRDISNKQMRQEEDMLSLRQQETALAQRRAENLNQDWEDVFRFAENRRQFDTKFDRATMEDERDFAANRSDTAWSQRRTAEQDMLRSQQWQQQFGLQQASANREARRLSLAEDRVGKQDQFDKDLLSVKPEQRAGLMGVVDRVRGFFGGETQAESPSVIEAQRQAAVRQGDAATAARLSRQLDALAEKKAGQLTAYQQAQQERYEKLLLFRQQQAEASTVKKDEAAAAKAQEQEIADMIQSDSEAWPSRAADKQAAASKYGKSTAEQNRFKADMIQARREDSDRVRFERDLALQAKSADEYANFLKGVGATPAALAKRREFWHKVRGSDPTALVNEYYGAH